MIVVMIIRSKIWTKLQIARSYILLGECVGNSAASRNGFLTFIPFDVHFSLILFEIFHHSVEMPRAFSLMCYKNFNAHCLASIASFSCILLVLLFDCSHNSVCLCTAKLTFIRKMVRNSFWLLARVFSQFQTQCCIHSNFIFPS